jgi:NAD(P)H-dependent flavin oxidoreductase YrpB (nitropropane dioxygenase family)
MCGWTLARAHARSGDAAAIAAYLGRGERFDAALERFSELYADLNERDHAALVAALRPGGRFDAATPTPAPAASA